MSKRMVLYLMLLLAPFLWGGLLLFTRFVPPHTLLAFIFFFLLLGTALTCIFSPLAYFIGLRFLSSRLYRATVRHAVRQGILLSLCIVLNLILRALHSWNIFTALLTVGAVLVIEILSLARK